MIDWSRIDPIGIEEVLINVSSKAFGTRNISAELKEAKFFYILKTKTWSRYVNAQIFTVQSLQESQWGIKADNVVVTIEYPDGNTSEIWKVNKGNWIRESID